MKFAVRMRQPRGPAPGEILDHRRQPLRALGKGTGQSLGKIQNRRGDPLRAHPREALERFLTDGRIEIDFQHRRTGDQPQTITRKNSLFAGSEGGGRTWATVATLLQTAK